jgi:hypothetical protein
MRRGGALRHPDRSAPRLGSRFAVGTGHLCQIKFSLMQLMDAITVAREVIKSYRLFDPPLAVDDDEMGGERACHPPSRSRSRTIRAVRYAVNRSISEAPISSARAFKSTREREQDRTEATYSTPARSSGCSNR